MVKGWRHGVGQSAGSLRNRRAAPFARQSIPSMASGGLIRRAGPQAVCSVSGA